MLLFITLKVSYYSTRETLKRVGRGEVVFFIYILLLFSLFKTSPFSLFPFCFLILFSLCLPPPNLPRKKTKQTKKKSCPLFPDRKDYHSDIFSLIIPFAQQPGRETQAAWQNRGAHVFGNRSPSRFSPR